MAENKKQNSVKETAQNAMRENKPKAQGRQFVLWFGALILGGILGWMGIHWLKRTFQFCGNSIYSFIPSHRNSYYSISCYHYFSSTWQ